LSTALESLLKRDRAVVLTGLVALSALAWGYLAHEARVMTHTGICSCAGMKMSGPDLQPWSGSTLFPLFLMWAEMMVAMMVPSAAPMILTFATVNRKRREQERPFVPTGVFLAGYLAVWTAFSALASLAQWVLHSTALLSPMMAGTSPVLGGVLLMAAGIFQWSPFKHACLAHCRSPLAFLLTDWRDGRLGAFVMGLKHGAYCTGCCWILMALLFVAGVMNVAWVAAISILVLLEKIAPRGLHLGRMVGLGFAAWGAWMLIAKIA
jgi:predicted metal-binding membrane protein